MQQCCLSDFIHYLCIINKVQSIWSYWFDFGGRGGSLPLFNSQSLNIMYAVPTKESNSFDKYDEPRLHMERLMKAYLVEFDLPLSILIPLESGGIKTLGDLVKQTRDDLLKIKLLGVARISKLELFLGRYGLELAIK